MMENIKINLDNEDFIKESMPLLKDLEERDYDLRKQHNSNFLIFVWFIITTAWVIISLNDVTLWTKYILISSIISYTFWYFCSFSHSSLQIQKFWKTIKWLLNWSNIDSMEKMGKEMNKINDVWKEIDK